VPVLHHLRSITLARALLTPAITGPRRRRTSGRTSRTSWPAGTWLAAAPGWASRGPGALPSSPISARQARTLLVPSASPCRLLRGCTLAETLMCHAWARPHCMRAGALPERGELSQPRRAAGGLSRGQPAPTGLPAVAATAGGAPLMLCALPQTPLLPCGSAMCNNLLPCRGAPLAHGSALHKRMRCTAFDIAGGACRRTTA
jgi:hypothetical protein